MVNKPAAYKAVNVRTGNGLMTSRWNSCRRNSYAQLAEVTYTASTKSDSFLQAVASTDSRNEFSSAAAVKSTDRSFAR